MTLHKQFLVLLLYTCFLIGCTQPFIDIGINADQESRQDIDQNEEPLAGRSPLPIEEFVKKRAAHGRSLAAMRAYAEEKKTSNVKELSRLLQKPNCGKTLEDGRVCSNVVTTLGAIGSQEALKAIQTFLHSGTTDDYRDKTAAVKAIGIWLNGNMKISDPRFNTLTRFVRESVIANHGQRKGWKDKVDQNLLQDLRKVRQELKALKSDHENDLIRSAISALVFAGGPGSHKKLFFATPIESKVVKLKKKYVKTRDDEIRRTLEDIQSAVDTENSDKAGLKGVITQARNDHKQIAAIGLDCYDQQGRHKLSEGCKKVSSGGKSSKLLTIKDKLKEKVKKSRE